MSALLRVQTLLGVTRMGRALGVLATCIALAAITAGAGGFWAGMRWQSGSQAIADRVELRSEVAGLQGQVTAMHAEALRLREVGVAIASDFRRAHLRQALLNQEHEERLHALSGLYQQLDQSASQYVEAHRADLAGCRLGADGLRLWTDAARADPGARPATGTAAGHPERAAGAVPAGLADPAERPGDRGVADLARGRSPVPPVPGASGQPDPGGG